MIEQILQADRLLQVDQVDRARDMYQRVADLDPGNAIARVGLAQCALADGDERGAYDLAAKALAIDPENDMARRMEARLAEILIVRGETVERPVVVRTAGSRAMRAMVTETVPADAGPELEAISLDAAVDAPSAPAISPGVPVTRLDPEQTPEATATATPNPPSQIVRRSLLDRLMGR